jgi:PAS domain S-box-containing protein
MNSKAEVSDNIVLESVLNKCETWIWIIDIQTGVVEYSNQAAYRDFGMKKGVFCHETMNNIMPETCKNCKRHEIENLPSAKSETIIFNHKTAKSYRKNEYFIDNQENTKRKLTILSDISELIGMKEFSKKSEEASANNNETFANIIWKTKIDIKGQFFDTYISPSADILLGLNPGTINNRFGKYFEYVYQEDIQLIKNKIYCVDIDENPFDIQYRFMCADGKIIWVRSHGKMLNHSNQYFEVFGSTDLIPNKKYSALQFEESQNRYFGLFNNLPIPSIIHRNGIVVDINQAALNFIEAPNQKQILGRNAMDFVHENSRQLAISRIKKMLAENVPMELVHEKYLTLTGEVKDVETIAVPFKYQNEIFIQVVFYDITDRLKNEQLLKENKEELAELNATKDKFFSLIAHDLKNPFHQILGFTELLADNQENYDREQTQNIIQYINTAAGSAYKLLENLLQWSRAQTGRIDFNPENLSVFDTIMSVIDLNMAACKRKEISISQDIEPGIFIFADREMTEGIIRNLLSNAIKFSYRKGKISVSAHTVNQEIHITVRDFGVGMSQEQIDKLYKIDQSHSTSGTEDEVGTGLGLILCKEFVQKNMGRLVVESPENKGCIFTLILPSERY